MAFFFTQVTGQSKNRGRVEESDVAVFLLSLKAGNAGLTLTAADYVFLFDPWWNTAVENQAIDRTHRIGQQSQVFAYRMICKDSIEEKIMKMAAGTTGARSPVLASMRHAGRDSAQSPQQH